jgi:hypothetical protein
VYRAAVRRACLLAAILLAAVVAQARGDGDPASDVLPVQDIYYTYAPPVSPQLTSALNELVASARRAGYPIKVALIETVGDLGAYSSLWGQPKRYAELLEIEISFNSHPRLLVVTPDGLVGRNLGEPAEHLLARIRVNRPARSNGLAQAALYAVARVATLNGHPLPVPRLASAALASSARSKRGSSSSALLYIAPALAAVLAAGALLVVLRRRGDRQT